MKYIHKFDSQSDFEDEYQNRYKAPWVSAVSGSSDESVAYNVRKGDNHPLAKPFTIVSRGSGTVRWNLMGDRTLQYSKNGSPYSTMTSGTTVSVVAGDEIAFMGENQWYFVNNNGTWTSMTPSCTMNFDVKGNALSLVKGDNFVSDWTLVENPDNSLAGTFRGLFKDCTRLVDAGDLLLPSDELLSSSYCQMFYGCTALTSAPYLGATKFTSDPYNAMFENCSSLHRLQQDELPAPETTMPSSFCARMFANSGLQVAPALPSMNLSSYCYARMFLGCKQLYYAPVLPAKNRASSCYEYMFSGCTNLYYVECYLENPPVINNWLSGVASDGYFVKSPNANWTRSSSGIPSTWTVYTDPEEAWEDMPK